MRKTLLVLALTVLFVPALVAQDLNHGSVGVFFDYTRLKNAAPNDLDMVGLGARLSFNVHSNIAMEAEGAYDFARAFNNTSTVNNVTTVRRSSLHLVHGMFGPKLQIGTGPVRAFGTVKGGFLTISGGNRSTTDFTITSANTHGVLYPGGGLEAYWGPVGFRLDVGDEIYFRDGANHNLKVGFGPHLRF